MGVQVRLLSRAHMKYIIPICLVCFVCTSVSFYSCSERLSGNPPAPGFNESGSDVRAMDIADNVMESMGGRRAWDQTRHIGWSFGGRRHLIWDKHTGNVRIDAPGDTAIYLINIFTREGTVQLNGHDVTDTSTLNQHLSRAYGIWVNDSYWLVMPFKLKDSGVTLKYLTTESDRAGNPSHVLELTFQDVGITPQNKYEVWVDTADNLIKQWAYFRESTQDTANSIWPWDNYQLKGSILLSGDRSDGRGPRNVKVYSELPESVFTEFSFPAQYVEL
jgi:hypothetical protein